MSPPSTSLSISGPCSELLRPRHVYLLNTTPVSGTIDSLTVSFAEQATNPYCLAAMVAGGTLGRTLRGGVLALGGSRSPLMITALAETVGLAGEVASFETTQRALRTGVGGASPSLLRWNGDNGLRNGLIHSTLSFGSLRGAARFSRGHGWAFQNLFQDTAMVFSHNLSARIGLTPRPHGSLTEQMIEAQALNLQLHAGMAITHGLIPSLFSLERGLDLSVPSPTPNSARERNIPGFFAQPALAQEGILGTLGARGPRELNDILNAPMEMSIKDLWGRLTGRPGASSERASSLPTVPAPPPGGGPPPEIMGYFQSYYHPEEVFALGRVDEGQQRTIGRGISTRGDVFPTHYRNISRRHLEVRVREGRLEIKPAPDSHGIRTNGTDLTPLFWYLLRHGDYVEFIGEGHRDRNGIAADFAEAAIEEGNRPALFRFFRAGEPAPPPSIFPPERAPIDTGHALTELKIFQDRLGGMINLYSQGLRETEEYLKAIPAEQRVGLRLSSRMLSVEDIIKLHRHLGGSQERTVVIEEEHEGALVTRTLSVPAVEGLLKTRLDFFEEALSLHENRFGPNPETQAARQHLATLRDQFDRMYRIVQIYRRFFETPRERALLDAVEEAYQGLSSESVLREARVRSETRSLDVTLTQAEREAWTREFLANVLEPRVVRNVMILTGQILSVQGRPVGGGFYRAVSQGTVCDGLRNVRALVDPSTGEFVAFHDETPASRNVVRQLEAEGRRYEEISLLVNVVDTGRIAQVIVSGSSLRDSVRNALHALVGLQVLPQGPLRLRETGQGFDTVFGITEYRDMENSEIWRMNFPVEADAPGESLYRVAAVTPYRESAGPEGVSQWTLVTLEPTVAGIAPIQIWTRTREVLSLTANSLVQAHQMR